MAEDFEMTSEKAQIIINNTPNEIKARLDMIMSTRYRKDLSVTFAELDAIKNRLNQTKRALLFLYARCGKEY